MIEAIAKLVRCESLYRTGSGGLFRGDHAGRRDARADRRVSRRAADERRVGRRDHRLRASRARGRDTDRDRRRAARHMRDRRGRAGDVQHLDPFRHRGGRLGREGRQARQPSGVLDVWLGRRSRAAGREDRPRSGRRGALHRRGRHRVPVRAGVPSVVSVRRRAAARVGNAHRVQRARAPVQSRRREVPGARRG